VYLQKKGKNGDFGQRIVMKDFEFIGTFGTEQKTVHITNSGKQLFERRIDNGYRGLI
jgi:hypothetical protein